MRSASTLAVLCIAAIAASPAFAAPVGRAVEEPQAKRLAPLEFGPGPVQLPPSILSSLFGSQTTSSVSAIPTPSSTDDSQPTATTSSVIPTFTELGPDIFDPKNFGPGLETKREIITPLGPELLPPIFNPPPSSTTSSSSDSASATTSSTDSANPTATASSTDSADPTATGSSTDSATATDTGSSTDSANPTATATSTDSATASTGSAPAPTFSFHPILGPIGPVFPPGFKGGLGPEIVDASKRALTRRELAAAVLLARALEGLD